MWVTVVGIAVVVLILAALIVPGRKNGKPAADGRMSTEGMAAAQRAMWAQAEQAVRAYADARGEQVGPARAHLLRMAAEVNAAPENLGAQGASERQVLMAKLAAEEIREFVHEALARHPERRQS